MHFYLLEIILKNFKTLKHYVVSIKSESESTQNEMNSESWESSNHSLFKNTESNNQ